MLKTSTVAVASLLLLTACTEPSNSPATTESDLAPVSESPAAALRDSGAGVDTLPQVPRESWEECPYLNTEWAADTNGQRVTGVGVDNTFDIPACVFWSYPEEPQLTVIVRSTTSSNEAMDIVDWAAPVDSTELAEKPDGWSGGRGSGGEGSTAAVYAVAKNTTAVVVFTNQEQSLKAQLVAEQVINNLGL